MAIEEPDKTDIEEPKPQGSPTPLSSQPSLQPSSQLEQSGQPSSQLEQSGQPRKDLVTQIANVFQKDSVKREIDSLLRERKPLKIAAALVASLIVLYAVGAAASIVDSIPVFNGVAEVVGAFYCVKFVYQYLLFAEGRQTLKDKFAEVVTKITGDSTTEA